MDMNSQAMTAHVQAELERATMLQAAGNKPEMISVLRRMFTLPAEGAFWGNVAHLLAQAADLDGAEVAARKFVDTCPGMPQAKSLLAGILGDIGKTDEAIPLAEEVAASLAHMPVAHYSLGVQLARANRLEEARQSFLKAIELDPDDAMSMEYLAYVAGDDARAETLAIIDAALDRAVHSGQPGEAALHYARATLLERAQQWPEAFEAYARGAQVMKSLARVDLAAMERYVTRLKRSFSARFFSVNSVHRHENKRPIFIVGMPRSGTTLVESILAAHSDVIAGGETALLGLATMDYRSFEPPDIQRIAESISEGKTPWADMGLALMQFHEARFGAECRVTEKNLGHHFLLGVVAMIAAGAPVIYCKRDPVATAWSCYKTRFTRGNGWSYAFDAIARYQRLYAGLMAHWKSVLPEGTILEVGYENLVTRPEETIPVVLAHAGLDMEDACLAPHRADRPVLTASLAQVRRPIHAEAVASWKHYETWLAPHIEELQQT